MAGKSTYEELKQKVKVLEQEAIKHKQTEEMLRESEEKHRRIFENLQDVYFEADMDGTILEVSPSIEKLSQYKREALIGKSLYELYTNPKDRDEFVRLILDKGKVNDYEIHLEDKDGSLRVCSITTLLIRDSQGTPEKIIGSMRDIAENKRAEELLRGSEERFRNVYDIAPLAFVLWDKNACVTDWNKKAEEIFGWSKEEVVNHNFFDFLIPEKNRPRVEDVVNNLLKGALVSHSIDENITKEGKIITCEWNNSTFHDDNGNIMGAISLGLDITEQKLAEEALRESEERLQQSQKMESIGTLAGGIAHDFNNILFPIVGCTEMLMEDIPEDSPLRNNLNTIFKGAMRAKDLVKQILAFSRQGSHEIKLMKMQSVIQEALKLIRSTIPTSIEIKQYVSSDCGPIKADPTQIHQVVMNLATNAYHAMEDTGGKLKVSLKEIEFFKEDLPDSDMEPGPYACLTVADTGVGIDKKMREIVFKPFFTTKGLDKGTGMGLSVIHGIVKNAGGSIDVYSEPGEGAEFRVYLPIVKNSSEHQETQTKAHFQRGTEQILIVDDEAAIVSMEKEMLERLGYAVISQRSSVNALALFRADPDKFDLVITDMAMPNISGDKLASELTKIRSDIPIVLCTGFSEKIPAEKAKTLGIKGFLMKPIVMKNLSDKVREVLDHTEGARLKFPYA